VLHCTRGRARGRCLLPREPRNFAAAACQAVRRDASGSSWRRPGRLGQPAYHPGRRRALRAALTSAPLILAPIIFDQMHATTPGVHHPPASRPVLGPGGTREFSTELRLSSIFAPRVRLATCSAMADLRVPGNALKGRHSNPPARLHSYLSRSRAAFLGRPPKRRPTAMQQTQLGARMAVSNGRLDLSKEHLCSIEGSPSNVASTASSPLRG
jgi:hypothetical protein